MRKAGLRDDVRRMIFRSLFKRAEALGQLERRHAPIR